MKLRNKILSLILALALLVPCIGNVTAALDASAKSLNIATAEDFVELAGYCSLDSWSKGKTVTLTADIDLSEYPNTVIPVFSGTFNGGGFKISGVEITASGSDQGLFRFVQEKAVVKDLTVEGNITADGELTQVGGIVGSNAGSIQSCTFNGIINGTTITGGIAGINLEKGQIISCTAKGAVNGKISVGGIAGENYGTVSASTNESTVGAEKQDGNVLDIGGIVGFSSGSIQNCTNNGTVGARHSGYNVGGIVGRQDGTVTSGSNTGEVFGRKDVGGIVGQAEPSISVVVKDDNLDELNKELTALYGLITESLKNSNELSADVQKRLKNASSYVSTASSNTSSLLNQLSGVIASGNGSDTSSTTIIYASLGNYTAALQDMETALGGLKDSSAELTSIVKALASVSSGASSTSKAQTAAEKLGKALEKAESDIKTIETSVSNLRNAVLQKNESNMKSALKEVTENVADLSTAFKDASSAVGDLKTNLAGIMSSDSSNQKKVQGAFGDLSTALSDMSKGATAISDNLKKITPKADIELKDLKTDLTAASGGAKSIADGADKGKTAFATVNTALKAFKPSVAALNDPVKKLADAAESASGDMGKLSSAANKIKNYMSELADANTANQTVTLTSSFSTQSQALYKAIVNLSSEISGIGTDVAGGDKDNTTTIKKLNEQLQKVMELMITTINETDSETGVVNDISDGNASRANAGKISSSSNSGSVTGDRDVGGIVGSMAIENALDPEDEQNDTLPKDNDYEVMDIVTGCVNDGLIFGTKSAVGGVVGRMDIGTVTECEGYGKVKGEGSYTGGIVGLSETSIRKCYSQSIVTGESYTGGVVGAGNRIDTCYAIVIVEGKEYTGAVAGWADLNTDDLVTNNFYVDNGIAAVDGVSYHDAAEAITLESLQKKNGLPSGFAAFTITCMADGEVVETVNVPYGTKLSTVEMPAVPDKAGRYGYWSDFNVEYMFIDQTVQAEYGPWVPVVSSVELDDGRAFALAEGKFTKQAVLHVAESKTSPPASDSWAVWDITLEDANVTEESVSTIKLLNQTGELASVWQVIGNEWVQVPVSRDGQYVAVEMRGTSATFSFRPDYLLIAVIAIVIIAAVAGIIVVIILMNKGKKSSKKNKKSGKKKGKKSAPKANGERKLSKREIKKLKKARKKALKREQKEARKLAKGKTSRKDKSARAIKQREEAKRAKRKPIDLSDYNWEDPLLPDFELPSEDAVPAQAEPPKELTRKEKREEKKREKQEAKQTKRELKQAVRNSKKAKNS